MNKDFVGTWKLISWNQLVDGREEPYFGSDTEGLLVYTVDGHMLAHVMGPERPRMGMPPEQMRQLATNLVRPWKVREVMSGLRALLSYFKSSLSYVAYAGTYRIEGDEVVHHVELSLIPDWVGTEQRRRFRFEADGTRLTLMVPPAQGRSEHVLAWTRV
jgi:hypothetical protein